MDEDHSSSSPPALLGTFVPLSICVRISLVYLSLLAIYAFLLSRAEARGCSLLSPFKLMYVTSFCSLDKMISVLSVKFTWTILLLSLNIMACLVFIHFLT